MTLPLLKLGFPGLRILTSQQRPRFWKCPSRYDTNRQALEFLSPPSILSPWADSPATAGLAAADSHVALAQNSLACLFQLSSRLLCFS